ncbi:ribonuclease HI family protein [Janthinobacterium lividum]|uniref:ribonuclease HI family protein n=1 Tax=Janthinobacterium lividum TaxID=29581 RepID=UPI0008752E2D|nr:ribonuclease HI family protein [Janthinobacterium lividum]MCC7712874.1 ribonuclease HI family protein [Janthinobacterium lividum]OEZ55793.1 bifunctional RNase H/acid phosphatase [Janthinobacterium lividum]WQE31311.1 ribonuclease HI family protein [Janthinobacterium lividum]STQ96839.1 bifunctional RNase H/acid phosphatase [Janthinobacterium lividum]
MQEELETLLAAAFKSERAQARRLAALEGIAGDTALRRILEQASGTLGLAALLATRLQAHAAEAQRKAQKISDRQQAQAARRVMAVPASAWRGWFDGSAHPNPGKLGIGALLLGPNGERIEVSEAAGYGSSSDAEYAALTAVLQAALKVRPPPVQLLLYGDSQVVINDVLGTTPLGAKGLETQRATVVALLEQFTDVSLRWLPRHRNGEADRLSQLAITGWVEED